MLHHELKKWFGFDTFKPGQQEIIEHVLNDKNTLGILPTGSGKSLCYQLPTYINPKSKLCISLKVCGCNKNSGLKNIKRLCSKD